MFSSHADPDELKISDRSRLYSLEPAGFETPYCESLISYIIRLAGAHLVSPRDLIKVIFPEADRRIEAWIYNRFFVRHIGSANGLGQYAKIFSEAGNKLTRRTDLHFLTMLPWAEIFPENGAGLISPYPRWCPDCFQEKCKGSGASYSPLLWSLQLYRWCGKHDVPLEDECPACSRRQPFIPTSPSVSTCEYCASPLYSARAPSTAKQEESCVLSFENGITACLESMIEHRESIAIDGTIESFTQTLGDILDKVAEGNRAKFCKSLVWNRKALDGWLSKSERPTLPKLVELACKLNLDPIELCTSRGMDLTYIFSATGEYERTRFFERKGRPALNINDRRRLEIELQELLCARTEPPSLTEVAETLRLQRSALKYWFPEISVEISRRHRNYRAAMRKSACQHRKEKVLEAIKSLIGQGLFPSRRRVDRHLKVHGLALARPELLQIYREAISVSRVDENRSTCI